MSDYTPVLSDSEQLAVLMSQLLAKQQQRHLVMAQGRQDPDNILYRLGRNPFLLRVILSFESSKYDMDKSLRDQYYWGGSGLGGEEELSALGPLGELWLG